MAHSAVDSRAQHERLSPAASDSPLWYGVLAALRPLASLKLTVVLFAMAIFIILAGTFAQVDKDIWEVINGYFRIDFSSPGSALGTAFVWIDLQLFFPPSFFPSKPQVPGGFPFPSGWLIGIVMSINLIAAHLLRFKVQARGGRLLGGLALIVAGILVTAVVIASGANKEGFQHASWIEWSTLWSAFKLGLLGVWLGTLYGWSRLLQAPETERWLLILVGLVAGLLGLLLGWLLYQGDAAKLGDSSMRILWQLIKGGFAGLVLLAGCIMMFKKRAGIVLLHCGILLMMAGEVLVGIGAVEGRMQIREGETVNFVQDLRSVELAFVDSSDPQYDDVVVVPESILRGGGRIEHDALPCDVELVEFYDHSAVRALKPGEESPATAGIGLRQIAEPARASTGTDTSGGVDLASAYVKFSRDTENGRESLGTYLVSQWLVPDALTVDGTTYTVSLQFKRTYKPYSVQLLDVRKDDYIGTDTPRNYSSDVRLVDPTRGVERKIHIWMNNPLRYAGETFYQSSYDRDQSGVEVTGLQVVTNTGWMIPYVACMIVVVGLGFQFGVTLLRFLNRRQAEVVSGASRAGPAQSGRIEERRSGASVPAPGGGSFTRYFPLLIVLLGGAWLLSKARAPQAARTAMQLYEFGKLPVVYQGRVKPLDTLARNDLRIISDKESFVDAHGHEQPAIQWLADVIARPAAAHEHRVFRIPNPEVLETLGLKRRKGYRYAVEEFRAKAVEFNEQVDQARATPAAELSAYQRKIIELDRKVRVYTLLQASLSGEPLPPFPTKEQEARDPTGSGEIKARILALLGRALRAQQALANMQPPLIVPAAEPPETASGPAWKPFATAWTEAYMEQNREAIASTLGLSPDEMPARDPNPAALALASIFSAYAEGDARRFNREVQEYRRYLGPQGLLAAMIPRDGPHWFFKLVGPTDRVAEHRGAFERFVQSVRLQPDAEKPITWEVPEGWHEQGGDGFRYATFEIGSAEGESPLELSVSQARGSVLANVNRWRGQLRLAPIGESQLEAVTEKVAVGETTALLFEANAPGIADLAKTDFEAYFNHLQLFPRAAAFYLAAFVLAVLGWLGWTGPLHRASFWLIAFTFVVHTIALISRIYISGRPPVTNLYSSAVFIGWGAVLFGMIFERIYRMGIGNAVAAMAGFATLVIANLLAGDGDTFTVLQAVLDTQFWLATHVVCITLGYATTYVAGLLGILYVVLGMCTPMLSAKIERDLARMIYGTLCFALFFSFFGTVLGGLWADDSWGRFWGWDPKENGALIIVLWNALVLHARWDGMARQRGLALLAVGGNIAVSWSWFGVNELGVGLHSYGFTEGVMMALLLFVVSQLAIIAAGALPKELWWSFRRRGLEEMPA